MNSLPASFPPSLGRRFAAWLGRLWLEAVVPVAAVEFLGAQAAWLPPETRPVAPTRREDLLAAAESAGCF